MNSRLKKYWLHHGLSKSESFNESLNRSSGQVVLLSYGCTIPFLVFVLWRVFPIDRYPVEFACYAVFAVLVTGLFLYTLFKPRSRRNLRGYLIYSLPLGTAGLYYNIWSQGPSLSAMLGTISCFACVTTLIRSRSEGLFAVCYFLLATAVCVFKHPVDGVIESYVPAALACLTFLSISQNSRLKREQIHADRSRVLSSSVQLWNSVLENVSINLALTDVDGTIVEIGRTHGGFEKDKVIGTSFRDYLPSEQRERYDHALTLARESQSAAVYEVTVPTPVGRPMTFTTSVWPIRERGETIGFMFFTVDVTDQMEANRKAHHLSQVSILGQLSASIAHEIRNPLTVITGNLDLIESQMKKGAPPPDMNARIEKLRGMTDRIGEIVRSVSRMYHSGEHEPVMTESVSGLIRDALSFSQQKCREKDISVEVIQNDPALTIACKALLVSQAIVNLIHNSIDAAKEFKERWIRIVVEEQGANVQISVIDSGPGIPQAVLANIGMPFYTTKGVGKGTGLGINLAKKIVEDHGGEFRYDQTSPHTKFDMIFPKQAPAADAA